MVECAFKNCINSGNRRNKFEDQLPNVTYHLFPRDPIIRGKWLKQMNQENWAPNSSSVLCSLHFNIDYFFTNARGISQLKADAIPTEFELFQDDNYSEMDENATLGCCAYKCTNVYSADSQITFHPFPLDSPDLCAQWLAAMNCSQIDGDQAVLCSDHFEENCFVYNDDAEKYLISDAVPSIFTYPDINENAGDHAEGEVSEDQLMETEPINDSNIIKYEVSEDNLELIRRHDEVVGELMAVTQRLVDLNSKRLQMVKKRNDLVQLLRATVYNTSLEKAQIRAMKPLLRELQDQYSTVLAHCMSPCMAGALTFDEI